MEDRIIISPDEDRALLGCEEGGLEGLSTDYMMSSLCENPLGCKSIICALFSIYVKPIKIIPKRKSQVELSYPNFEHTLTHMFITHLYMTIEHTGRYKIKNTSQCAKKEEEKKEYKSVSSNFKSFTSELQMQIERYACLQNSTVKWGMWAGLGD